MCSQSLTKLWGYPQVRRKGLVDNSLGSRPPGGQHEHRVILHPTDEYVKGRMTEKLVRFKP
jgi:hypothetical protein